MDNPQIPIAEAAWLAGIWDGEGHISIRRTILQKNRKPQFSPRCGMTNTNTQIVNRVRQILDGLGITYYFGEKPPQENHLPRSLKQCWVVEIHTLPGALKLLAVIRPYLVGKGFQADCVLEFCERRLKMFDRHSPNSARVYTPKDFELVGSILEANGDVKGISETVRQDALRARIQSIQ